MNLYEFPTPRKMARPWRGDGGDVVWSRGVAGAGRWVRDVLRMVGGLCVADDGDEWVGLGCARGGIREG